MLGSLFLLFLRWSFCSIDIVLLLYFKYYAEAQRLKDQNCVTTQIPAMMRGANIVKLLTLSYELAPLSTGGQVAGQTFQSAETVV